MYPNNRLKLLRKQCIEMSANGGDGNLQSVFSSLPILWILYDQILKSEDCFVLSKGQSNMGLMAVLAYKNIIPISELQTFCGFDSRISMQADRTKFNDEIKTSAGSLGHGLPMACGIALAKKIKNEPGRVYCLCGDGEFNEGTMWESCIFASSKKLDNLYIIIDNNKSLNKMINIGSLQDKISIFGFNKAYYNYSNLYQLPDDLKAKSTRPVVINTNTIRGYGCKTFMEDSSWFHRHPKENEVEKLLNEVENFEETII